MWLAGAWFMPTMGACRNGNVVKCFCALVVTVKHSTDEIFMHYFLYLSSASGGFAPDITSAPALDPARTFVPNP